VPFTDEDLKRLKMRKEDPLIKDHTVLKLNELDALLARLEAAEKVCGIGTLHECLTDHDCWTCKALAEWRKAAGK
jgi:hypothetical protein